MIDALLFLQYQAVKNRLMVRFKRLRQPKYLVGAIFGVGYLGMVVLRPLLLAHSQGGVLPTAGSASGLWEFFASLLLLGGVALAWLLPHERAGLVFSEPEIAFLFPAPVRRSTLINFKLIKAQFAILFTIAILTVLGPRAGGALAAGERALAWWLLLTIINLHLLGASFARTMLLESGISTWTRRGAVLIVALVLLGGAAAWVRLDVPALRNSDLQEFGAMTKYLDAVAASAPSRVLLAPFRAAIGPFFAAGTGSFGWALLPALGLFAAHYWWVLRADVAFEESSVEVSRRHATRVAAMRVGDRWRGGRPRRKARAPFPLSPTGPPAIGLLWKNLLSAGQLFSLRVMLPLIAWSLCLSYVLSDSSHTSPWSQIIGTMAITLAGFSALLGAQILRNDFRQDLASADLLKTYPMSGFQMALGQVLSPAIILTVVQWLLLGAASVLFDGEKLLEQGVTSGQVELACVALLAPPMNLITLFVPNAAALLYPAWFRAGQSGGRGIETFGQQLMFTVALIAIVALSVAPAAAAFGFVYLVGPLVLPPAWALTVSALGAALVLAAEGVGGLFTLGRLFERFDPSAEPV